MLIEQDNYNVAVYCRLSTEDRNTNVVSSSIKTQEESLTEYVRNKGWNIYKVYSDDGFSGTEFNRPSFNIMIDDIKKHKVNLVITKDLSRLGRNHIQSGYYLEQFFPENNVRYIALNDNYDSLNSTDEFIQFKNITNEFYAKDISNKIRFAYNTKVANGTVIPTQVPYGYLKVNKKIIVDEKVKDLIIRIFNDYIDTGSSLALCKNLTKEGHLIPSLYNLSNNIRKLTFSSKGEEWTQSMILKIIKCEAYKGIFVAKKTYNVSFKDKKRRNNDPSNFIRVHGIYEPIVSTEVWEKANKLLKSLAHNPYDATVNKYVDVLVCGHCGAKMKLVSCSYRDGTKFFAYCCKNYANGDSGHRVTMKELDDAVRSELLKLKDRVLEDRDKFYNEVKKYLYDNNKPKVINNDDVIKELHKRSKQLDQLSEKVLEKNVSGLISSDTADSLLKKYKNEKKDIESKLKLLKKEEIIDNSKTLEENARTLVSFLESFDENILIDRELIISVISKISIKTEPIDGKWNRKFITIEFLGLPIDMMGGINDGTN